MMILFNLVSIFFKINALDSLKYIFYVFFFLIILLGLNILLSIDIFSLGSNNFYMIPFIGIIFILKDITISVGVLSS